MGNLQRSDPKVTKVRLQVEYRKKRSLTMKHVLSLFFVQSLFVFINSNDFHSNR